MRTSASPLVLAVALAFPAAHAEEPSTLGTVSVTAKGYAADDLETPLSTTSLDRTELLRRNAQNLGEALRGEPGLAVASDGAHQCRLNVRHSARRAAHHARSVGLRDGRPVRQDR